MIATSLGAPLLHEDLSREIIGCFFDVYNELGCGFLESVYRRAMSIALYERGIPSEMERRVLVHFREVVFGEFRSDLVIDQKIILEIKTAEKIHEAHEAQVLNYLKATRIPLGFVLNFGPKATFRRLILSPRREKSALIGS